MYVTFGGNTPAFQKNVRVILKKYYRKMQKKCSHRLNKMFISIKRVYHDTLRKFSCVSKKCPAFFENVYTM